MTERKITITDFARDMMHSPNFTTLENPEKLELVRLSVKDLGFPGVATTDQIYAMAGGLGLDLCPAETGPHQRLQDLDQPMGDLYLIAVKQISDRYGDPDFRLGHYDDGLWLGRGDGGPGFRWRSGYQFVFRVRNVSPDAETL